MVPAHIQRYQRFYVRGDEYFRFIECSALDIGMTEDNLR